MDIPGFVDLQVNGYKGVDFSSSELTRERFVFACQELIKNGTVLFLPTIISSSEEVYQHNLKLISDVLDETDLKNHIPGIHLEGPFISDENGARGAHNSRWIQKPDIDFLDQLIEWSGGKVKLLTIAAEPEGSEELCKHAADFGLRVSLGHQMASEFDLQRLAGSGASMLTHLGNGIPQKIDRHKNPIWAGLANDDLSAMIITDGHHIPASLIKTVIRAKGVSNTIVVSDASPIAGLPPGTYSTLGNNVILEESGRLYNPETGYLVGSSSTMIDCMNYLASLDFVRESDLLEMGFYNPIRQLKLDSGPIIDNLPKSISTKDGRFVLTQNH